jgi:hypothetical protein
LGHDTDIKAMKSKYLRTIVIALSLSGIAIWYAMRWQRKAMESQLDHRIVTEISALMVPQLRALSEHDPMLHDCGEFRLWEPNSWHRQGPWPGEPTPWELVINGFAHFEKADVYVQVRIGSGPQSLTLVTTPNPFFPARLVSRIGRSPMVPPSRTSAAPQPTPNLSTAPAAGPGHRSYSAIKSGEAWCRSHRVLTL